MYKAAGPGVGKRNPKPGRGSRREASIPEREGPGPPPLTARARASRGAENRAPPPLCRRTTEGPVLFAGPRLDAQGWDGAKRKVRSECKPSPLKGTLQLLGEERPG